VGSAEVNCMELMSANQGCNGAAMGLKACGADSSRTKVPWLESRTGRPDAKPPPKMKLSFHPPQISTSHSVPVKSARRPTLSARDKRSSASHFSSSH
jgi:hypothetical protein